MSPYPYHCVGMFGPGTFKASTESTSSVPDSKPMKVYPKDFVITGSSWDSWSPEQVRAAKAERRAWELAAQKAYTEKAAAAAAAPGAYNPNEPEPGATTNDIRVYTRLKNGQYKYWGIRDDDMDIEDFWAKYDPENTRYLDDNEDNPEDSPINLVPAQATSSPNNPSPRTSASSSSKGSQKIPQINPQHRVRKSATVTPQTSKHTRKSLAAKVGAELAGLENKIPDIPENASKSRRSAAHLAIVDGSEADTKGPRRSKVAKSTPVPAPGSSTGRGRPRKAQPETLDSARPFSDLAPSHLAKRKRGRPAQTKSSSKRLATQDRPAAECNSKITKPKQKMQRSPAPSIHAMRTRAKGPLDLS